MFLFSLALWLIFRGGWVETTVQTKDWWWPWLFPRHGAPFCRQTWHIESLYVQMFYPLESLKVLGAPVPWDSAKGLWIIRAQSKFVMLATSAAVVSNPKKLQVPPWHQSLRFVNCWIDGTRPLRVCCGRWNSWSVQNGISTRWYPTVSQFAKLVYNSYNLGLW